jgi:Flp pilus assembly pilin Flp
MTGVGTRLVRACHGATAAEFALVLPTLIAFLLGIIDAGRLMWTWNRAEKATQVGVRYAVVTEVIPRGLASYSFSVSGGIPPGDTIPKTSFGGASCNSPSTGMVTCACYTGQNCPPLGIASVADFQSITARMQRFMPDITESNVVVDYAYSGLGYAGDPSGTDVAPLVTVRLRGMTFTPLLFQFFGGTVALPDFRASLTLEDGAGTVSN